MLARAAAKATSSEKFQFGPWSISAVHSHILKSDGPERERYDNELKLPQFPEMVFANNILQIKHEDGFGLEFNTLDALRLVDAEHDLLKVAVSEAWKESRKDCEHINDVIRPFDWTFTTDYKGTLTGSSTENKLKVVPTTERIDLERLKVHEKIHFYEDILLFEDELADNGVSILSVKMRVMASGFFILLRLHMRVDSVLIRIKDTRIYHQAGSNYMIREYSNKECLVKDLKQFPPHILTDANEVSQHLPITEEVIERLEFPDKISPQST